MIFYPSLNVLDKLQNYIPVILSFPPPISRSISSSMGDIRNILNTKEDLEEKGVNRTVVSETAYTWDCAWDYFQIRCTWFLFPLCHWCSQAYLPKSKLLINVGTKSKSIYLFIANSLSPQCQLHPNQKLRFKRRGENQCKLLQTAISLVIWSIAGREPNDSFFYLAKMLPHKFLIEVRKLFSSFIYSSRYIAQRVVKTFLWK